MLSGVILAGNIRSGIGAQKPGMALIKEHVGRMRKVCSEIIISTNEPRPYLELFGNQVRIVTDFYKGKGPLSGMHAAMSLAANEVIWIVDGELPSISTRVASLLYDEQLKGGWHAVFPSDGKHIQPYHSIYTKHCVERIHSLLQLGNGSVKSFLEGIEYTTVPEDVFFRRGVRPENYNKIMRAPVM